MRVDLGLQRTQLHARTHFFLALQLKTCQLCGDELGKTAGQSHLTCVDVAIARVVQLEGAHAAVTHDERRNNAGVEVLEEVVFLHAGIVRFARKRLHALGLDGTQRGVQHDRLAGRTLI